MNTSSKKRLVALAAAALGVAAGCGGAPPAAQSEAPAQVIDGEARCGVGSDEGAREGRETSGGHAQ